MAREIWQLATGLPMGQFCLSLRVDGRRGGLQEGTRFDGAGCRAMIVFTGQITRQLRDFEKSVEAPGGTWKALVKLFAMLDFRDRDHIWMGAEAVYGWMPYMLDRVDPFPEFFKLVRTLRRLSGPYEFRRKTFDSGLASEALEILRRHEQQTPFLLTAVKTRTGPSGTTYSVVATSKFLHFLMPSVVPIWDSRVSRSLGKKSPTLSPTSYLRYVAAVHAVARQVASGSSLSVPTAIETALKRDNEGKRVPRVRQIEYWLYLT